MSSVVPNLYLVHMFRAPLEDLVYPILGARVFHATVPVPVEHDVT